MRIRCQSTPKYHEGNPRS